MKLFEISNTTKLLKEDIMKTLLSKYKHVWTLLYFPVYLAVFFWLENRSVSKYHVVQSTLDSHIPFLEIFIIPYFLWFGFVALGVVYFFFKDVKDYYRLIAFLYSGMTIFLIWSYVYPNRLFLRPMAFTRDNIFIRMVQHLYAIDTPTNVFPSIHVFNSLGIAIAVLNSNRLRNFRAVRIGSVVLATLIVLSTMFLKQHSLIDVTGGCVMAATLYWLIYQCGYQRIAELFRRPANRRIA